MVLLPAKLLQFSGLAIDPAYSPGDTDGIYHIRVIPSNLENFADDDVAQLCTSFNRNRDFFLQQIFERRANIGALTPRTKKEYDDLKDHVGLVWGRLSGAKGHKMLDPPNVRSISLYSFEIDLSVTSCRVCWSEHLTSCMIILQDCTSGRDNSSHLRTPRRPTRHVCCRLFNARIGRCSRRASHLCGRSI